MIQSIKNFKAAFRYSPQVLNIYSTCNVCCRFWALAATIGTHSKLSNEIVNFVICLNK